MNDLKFICALLESQYVKLMKEKYKEMEENALFPSDWYIYENYEVKINFLNIALKENKILTELDGINAINEQVNIIR